MVQDGNDLCEAILGKIPVDSICPSWLLFSPAPRSAKALLVYKRLSSVVGATVGLLLSFPTMALIALAVRLDSPGPIIFRQRRVGKDGKIFTLYKFRSMRDVVEREGKDEPARERDGRFTRVGHWLRRTRLDELPQLYNILRGDMSFVGPRPFVPSQEEECAREIPFYRYRWTVKPGATGWAQINRGYCMTLKDNTEKISYDLYYIKNMSMGLDVVILFRTIKILLLGRGAQ